MTGVASKNLYELLGNDPDQDPELRTPEPPVNPIDKPAPRTGKRNGPAEAPVRDAAVIDGEGRGGRGGGERRGGRGGRGGRGRGRGDSEGAFLDAGAGRSANRDRPTDEARSDDPQAHRFREPRGRGQGRGRGIGRGRGGPRGGDNDKHSHSVHQPGDQSKQAAHGWGEETGNGEWNDERAGEAIAQEEAKAENTWNSEAPVTGDDAQFGGGSATNAPAADQFGGAPAEENNVPEEPEDKSKSYAEYLAELAQKKLQLGNTLTTRQANEGAAKNMPEGKAVKREETDFFAGSGPRAARQRERKQKDMLVLDHEYGAPVDQGGHRGGRGGRGRGRGGDRGDRGEGRGRGFGRGRGGDGEGFRGRGRGGGRGGSGPAPSVNNTQDFPGLGGS